MGFAMDLRIGYGLAALTAITWGLAVIPVKQARTSGVWGLGISLPAGVATLAAFVLINGAPLPGWQVLASKQGLLLALAGVCQFSLGTAWYYESVRAADITTVVPLTLLKSVFVVALVLALGMEEVSARVGLACLVGLLGAVALAWRSAGVSASRSADLRRGVVLAVLTACSWAVGDVLVRLGMADLPALAATFVSLSAGALAYYIAVLACGRLSRVTGMPTRDKARYVVHGIVSFGIGYFAMFAAIKQIGNAPSVVITSAWPAVCFIVGLVMFRERLTGLKALGFALMMASVLLVIKW